MEKQVISRIRGSKVLQVLYCFWFFVFLIILRLFYLQIDQRLRFLNKGQKNFIRTEIIPPLRGDVFDCHAVLLAANRPVFDLYWQGRGGFHDFYNSSLINKVFSIVGLDFTDKAYQKLITYAEKYSRRVLIKQDVSFSALCRLNEQCFANEGRLIITNRFERFYPHRMLASHVLGYLSRADQRGKSGIEQCFQPELEGRIGYSMTTINATGRILKQTIQKEAQSGADVTLTIDSRLQRLSESLFAADTAGAIIVIDPATGALRALSSFPNFDPNLFLNPLSPDDWSRFVINNPLLNRATCAMYPPASIFKLVTFTAGLEEGLITQDSEIWCNGSTTFGGRQYFCMRHSGHGNLTPKQALAFSCNIPCYQIGRKLNIDRLATYAQRFGLGQKTNFVLPEKNGLIPTTTWKKQTLGERWWRGETLSVCIGQGYLLTTPMQVARMVGAICTGYLVKPRLLEGELIERSKLEITQSTLQFLRCSLKEAVSIGTGKRLSWLKDFDLYAKTGTAQTCGLEQEQKHKHQFEHAWFAGYFSYKGSSPLVLVILVENVGSSNVAVQMAGSFLKRYGECCAY